MRELVSPFRRDARGHPIAHATCADEVEAFGVGRRADWPCRGEWVCKGRDSLFTIARSKNANIVRYDVHRGSDGTLDRTHPIDAYWVMLAGDGHREELSWLERQLAYGFSASTVDPSGFSLQLTAFKQRAIRVEYSGGSYHATISISGARATLTQIFVRTDERGLLPRVEYVELRGTTDGRNTVTERLFPH